MGEWVDISWASFKTSNYMCRIWPACTRPRKLRLYWMYRLVWIIADMNANNFVFSKSSASVRVVNWVKRTWTSS
jgi:hypothetical protein